MNRNYTVDLNFNFTRPLKIEVKVIVDNSARDAELARQLNQKANELQQAIDENKPENP
jgi:ribulose 1,5-bisphosphate synthetase/thiazole synthase